ncbi:MAG: magnesium/cobalt transporter CorA [Myxococcota bacterium]|nr:magnesium/cobalt transporter CorA [Myxococcota bacterium]
MITVRVLGEGGLQTGGAELLGAAGLKWIDILNPTAEELAPVAVQFGLHPLEVEDCLHLDQRPKLEEYPGHLFLVLHGFQVANGDLDSLELVELHTFLGPDWLISVHQHACTPVDAAARRLSADPEHTLGRGVDFALYVLADALVDSNFPILDLLSDEVEDLQDKVFEFPRPAQLQRIFALKRSLVMVRRVLSPQRDVVALFARRGMPQVQERTALYFRDVYDHLVRLYEQIDSARDLLSGATEGYLSSVANRTNDITKQLTIFSTIFLPLSFITGFFGQNFELLSARGFFWAMVTLVGVFPVALVFWFRHKGWIGAGP